MSKQLEWAKDYIGRYDEYMSTRNGMVIGGVEELLYRLAQAMIEDSKEAG